MANDVLHQKMRVKIEYNRSSNQMKIRMEGSEEDYYANLEKVSINPKVVDVNSFEIRKNGVSMDFNAPLICDAEKEDVSDSLLVGVKFEGKDKDKVDEEVEKRAKDFGPEWKKAVEKRRERIRKRQEKMAD
ncbi:MAG: hypothetical protein V5A64_02055 [Candidatus Thermoplasmatota archaeon]